MEMVFNVLMQPTLGQNCPVPLPFPQSPYKNLPGSSPPASTFMTTNSQPGTQKHQKPHLEKLTEILLQGQILNPEKKQQEQLINELYFVKWRTRKAGGVIQSESQGLRNPGSKV